MIVQGFPPQRRHTLHFLDSSRAMRPVLLNIDVRMENVEHLRQAFRLKSGRRLSYVTVIARTIAGVVAKYPAANATLRSFPTMRICYHSQVAAKITFDKQWAGQRVVLSAVVPSCDRRSLSSIQDEIDSLREAEPERATAWSAIRRLNRLPLPLGNLAYRFALWPFANRSRLQGTFTLTSLGHRGVRAFFPFLGSTLAFGVGAAEPRAVVIDGRVAAAKMLTLNLAFDHRVIDGATAAELLDDVRNALEADEITSLFDEVHTHSCA